MNGVLYSYRHPGTLTVKGARPLNRQLKQLKEARKGNGSPRKGNGTEPRALLIVEYALIATVPFTALIVGARMGAPKKWPQYRTPGSHN